MAVKPLDDRVLLKPMEGEDKTPGGIVLPDTAKEKPMRGKIVALGPGKILDNGKRAKMDLKKGDEVLYGKFSGTEVKVKGEELLILRESDILAKVVKS